MPEDLQPPATPPAIDPEYANSNRSLATGLAGSSVAIFTFAMFFLYDRAESGTFDPILFQITVAVLLASVFLFGYSGISFYWVMEAALVNDSSAARHVRLGDVSFVLGLSFLMIGPALILFTARLLYLGLLGVALWAAMLLLILRGGRRSH